MLLLLPGTAQVQMGILRIHVQNQCLHGNFDSRREGSVASNVFGDDDA